MTAPAPTPNRGCIRERPTRPIERPLRLPTRRRFRWTRLANALAWLYVIASIARSAQ